MELSGLLPAFATALSINLLTSLCPPVFKKVVFNPAGSVAALAAFASATDDSTCNERFELGLLSLTVWIRLIIKPILPASDLVITFANILELSGLLPAFATALSINLLTSLCPPVFKKVVFNPAGSVAALAAFASATDDSTCNERFELGLLSLTVWIRFIIKPILPASDLVITFANILELSGLLPAFATALSINLLTSLCPPVFKKVVFNPAGSVAALAAFASATDDNTCNERFELGLLVSDNETIFIIFSIVAPSDFEIILPIVSTLAVSLNIWV